MFIINAKISDLWSLDILGITDPIGKRDQMLQQQKVRENFFKTVHLNEKSRYSVDSPWKNDHTPVSENYSVARKRLDGVVRKLKENGNFDIYNNIFKD